MLFVCWLCGCVRACPRVRSPPISCFPVSVQSPPAYPFFSTLQSYCQAASQGTASEDSTQVAPEPDGWAGGRDPDAPHAGATPKLGGPGVKRSEGCGHFSRALRTPTGLGLHVDKPELFDRHIATISLGSVACMALKPTRGVCLGRMPPHYVSQQHAFFKRCRSRLIVGAAWKKSFLCSPECIHKPSNCTTIFFRIFETRKVHHPNYFQIPPTT